ncbi:hypothetical protein LL912_17690 [Niabella sp. CC-SYL272]|uniref:hypothetical protein n=1 Tax=Niabella agricola TaxID=2891571 RepID=UPI001F2E8BC8|nr:hypothetical protein [Niabella agricola]MCF3110623.1 hypothetical protein [Niabella agricola]
MKKLKLKVLELGATEILTREQMKKVMGGEQRYECHCVGGANSGSAWQYQGSSTPEQSTIDSSTSAACAGATSECGWVTCGNPEVTC